MVIYRLAGSLATLEQEASLLWDLGCQGILEDEASIVAYFEHAIDIPLSGQWEEVADKDWLEAYYAELQPVVLERLIVAPRHCKITPDDRKVLWLDPGMAFGTGHHATTLMALRALERSKLKAKDVLDIGSGSGILAIAADLLGAARSYGIDIDAATLPVALANAEVNHSAATFALTDVSQLDTASADIIVANLYAELHSQLMQDYQRLLRPGGRLLLTGILAEREQTVLDSARDGFVLMTREQTDEWVLLDLIADA